MGINEAVGWGKEILSGLVLMVKNIIMGKGVGGDVAGPIGIYEVSKQVSKFGILPVLQFMGVLSINLAILNLLPFPGLDGGRVAFIALEKVIGRKLKDKIEGTVHTVGIMVLISLMVLITFRDIVRLFKG